MRELGIGNPRFIGQSCALVVAKGAKSSPALSSPGRGSRACPTLVVAGCDGPAR